MPTLPAVSQRWQPPALHAALQQTPLTQNPADVDAAAPDLRLDTQRHDLETNALQVEQLLETSGVIRSGDRPVGGEFAI